MLVQSLEWMWGSLAAVQVPVCAPGLGRSVPAVVAVWVTVTCELLCLLGHPSSSYQWPFSARAFSCSAVYPLYPGSAGRQLLMMLV